jgi:hypothetical protein
MQFEIRRNPLQYLGVAAQILFLALGAKLDSRSGWLFCLAGMATFSLYAWLQALKRRRAITHTPTSRIVSAAQGYTELQGRGQQLDGPPLRSHLSGRPCLWYRWHVEERGSNNKWRTVEHGASDNAFLLDDSSGGCLVNPSGADITTRHKENWRDGNWRYTEWSLLDGDPVYVIGFFRTIGGNTLVLDKDADIREMLGEWKKQPAMLKQRFDLDGDGEIDLREWELARQAARREVEKQHREARAQPDLHIMEAPTDGRAYLISNFDPDKLAWRYGAWSLLHLSFFVAVCGAIPLVFRHYA